MNDRTLRRLFGAMTGPHGKRLLRSYQDVLLRRQVAHAAAHSPFYGRKFAELGIDLRSIRGVADLPKLGFLTLPSDLQSDPYGFLAVPREEILYAMSSSGTTGKPKIVFMTRRDWEIGVRMVSNAMAMMGAIQADVAQILFYYGSMAWMTGVLLQSSLERLGVFVLPTGSSAPVAQQIDIMRQFGTTMLLGTPSYLRRLTEEGRRLADLRSLGVKLIRLGAEPWSEELRAFLQQAWGAQVYDAYGMMELGAVGAGECRAQAGLHLSPYLLVEVIDPQTGRPVRPGELGELVFTPLLRQGSPLLRYRSRDMGRLLAGEPCPCGELPTDRISRIVGRTDDLVFLGSGENAFPAQIEAALVGIEGVTGAQVIIEKDGYRDRLILRAEALEPGDTLAQLIRQRMYDRLPFLEHEINQSQMISPLEVEFLAPGSLQRESQVKVRHLVDRRASG